MKKTFEAIPYFLKSIGIQIAVFIFLFFFLPFFPFIFKGSIAGKHIFNSYQILVTIVAAIGITIYLFRKHNLNVALRILGAVIALLPAGFIAFTILANVSFLFPRIKQVEYAQVPETEFRKTVSNEYQNLLDCLPDDWELLEDTSISSVNWAYVTHAQGIKIKVYGRATGSRIYFSSAGTTRTDTLYNESRIFYLMQGNFDPNWNYLNQLFSEFRIVPIELPSLIIDDDRCKVYAEESIAILPENIEREKTTPEGFIGAHGAVMPKDGGSWKDWKTDVENCFKEKGYKAK